MPLDDRLAEPIVVVGTSRTKLVVAIAAGLALLAAGVVLEALGVLEGAPVRGSVLVAVGGVLAVLGAAWLIAQPSVVLDADGVHTRQARRPILWEHIVDARGVLDGGTVPYLVLKLVSPESGILYMPLRRVGGVGRQLGRDEVAIRVIGARMSLDAAVATVRRLLAADITPLGEAGST